MKAVILEETRRIAVREIPDAEMSETTDVLLRITSSAICGTDLHFYEGRMRGLEGNVIGHEPLGIVEERNIPRRSLSRTLGLKAGPTPDYNVSSPSRCPPIGP